MTKAKGVKLYTSVADKILIICVMYRDGCTL